MFQKCFMLKHLQKCWETAGSNMAWREPAPKFLKYINALSSAHDLHSVYRIGLRNNNCTEQHQNHVISQSTLPCNCKTFTITIQELWNYAYFCIDGASSCEPEGNRNGTERAKNLREQSGERESKKTSAGAQRSAAQRGAGGRRAGAQQWAEITEMGFNVERQNSPLRSNALHRSNRMSAEKITTGVLHVYIRLFAQSAVR